MKDMVIKKFKLNELNPAKYNPRKKLKPGDKEFKKLEDSIKNFGYVELIVVNAANNNTVISGHQRLSVLKHMGETEAECVVVELSEYEEKALNIAMNKVAGAWDEHLLAELLEDIANSGEMDVAFTGFDPPEIGELFNKLHDKNVKEDNFDIDSELKQPCFSKPGDLWLIGKHRVICGDSTGEEVYTRLMDGQKANLVLTDPPYGVDVEETAGKIQNDNLPDAEFYDFLLSAFRCMHANLADDGSIYVWHADTKGLIFRKAYEDAGFYLSGCCIWKKNALVLGRSPYQWIHEPCQPAGTMVWTPDGPVPIETIHDGDRVVSFNVHTGMVTGYRDGVPVKTASRPYSGNLYGVGVDGKQTWATDNHQFSVHFNPDTAETWCTYLMVNEKGWWRVGICRTYDARGFGLKHRVNQENASAAWLIDTFHSQAEAQMGEQLLATKYGIPYTHWTIERGTQRTDTQRTEENVGWLYRQIDLKKMEASAKELLRDYGRSIDYPLVTKETGKNKFSRRVTARINACNLIPNLMMVPVPYEHWEGTRTFEYRPIEKVDVKPYDGIVYSLQVEKFGHYIADGIVTHNCLFGWKKGGRHQWYADRKQVTVWEYDKPKSSPDHPTTKPVTLMAYPMKNSTMTNGIVLDPFLGSGSTLIACMETDRICRGIELDPKFVDCIVKRAIAHNNGKYDDVFVIRDGQKLRFDEVAAFEPEEAQDE